MVAQLHGLGRGRLFSLFCAFALTFGIAAVALASSADRVEAQAALACAPAMTVSTPAELDHAITCYNAATESAEWIITLAADIDYGNISGIDLAGAVGATSITQAADGLSLTIDGAGNSIIGPGGNFFDLAILGGLIEIEQNAQVVTIANTTLELTRDGGIAVAANGLDVVLLNGTVHGPNIDPAGVVSDRDENSLPTLIGIVSSGDAVSISIQDSNIEDARAVVVFGDETSVSVWNSILMSAGGFFERLIDVSGRRGMVSVSDSSLMLTAPDGTVIAMSGDETSVSVSNSTLMSAGGFFSRLIDVQGSEAALSVEDSLLSTAGTEPAFGIAFLGDSDSRATVSNTTIVGAGTGILLESGFVSVSNGTITTPTGVNTDGRGSATVQSSVVSGGCFGRVTGLNNFTGEGFLCGNSQTLTGTLPTLADNGCGVATPTGCVQTIALPADSNAVDAGSACADGLVNDQRGLGFARLIGGGCDAGAFETGATMIMAGGPLLCEGQFFGGADGSTALSADLCAPELVLTGIPTDALVQSSTLFLIAGLLLLVGSRRRHHHA